MKVARVALPLLFIACGHVEKMDRMPVTPQSVAPSSPADAPPPPVVAPTPPDSVEVASSVEEVSRPGSKLTRTITLGKGNDQPVFDGPSRGIAAESGSAGPTYVTTINNYGGQRSGYGGYASSYGYRGGYARSLPSLRVPAQAQPQSGAPPVGGNWPTVPSYGPRQMR